MTPVRVLVVAESLALEREIKGMLSGEESIQVVEPAGNGLFVDVLVVAGARPRNLPADGNVVYLNDDPALELEGSGRAWLPLHCAAAELTAAVLAAAHDLTVLTERQVRRHLTKTRALSETGEVFVETLTNRELEVLRMVADGLVNKEIAGRLGISDHTAKFHVAQILAKLGAGSRTEAVTIAIRRGLVPI